MFWDGTKAADMATGGGSSIQAVLARYAFCNPMINKIIVDPFTQFTASACGIGHLLDSVDVTSVAERALQALAIYQMGSLVPDFAGAVTEIARSAKSSLKIGSLEGNSQSPATSAHSNKAMTPAQFNKTVTFVAAMCLAAYSNLNAKSVE